MGNGLCRWTGDKDRVDAIGGRRLCRKIVFDYVNQWTRFSNTHPKSGEKNVTKRHNKRGKTKPVISGPLPADPDRLEGDKWRYVILTRLDTDPPPERPPRTRRRRLQQRRLAGTADGGGRRGSARRPRPVRRHPVTVAAGRGQLTDATARRSRRRRRPATAVAAMGPGLIVRRDGFFAAVDRCFSMADGLSS